MKRPDRIRYAVLLLLSCFLVSGCAGAGQQGAGPEMDPARSQDRPGYRFQHDNYRYMKDEGRFGIRNSNPNLSDVGQYSHSKPDRKTVEKQMRDTARQVEGVKDARVEIVGGHAAIKVIPENHVPKEDYTKLEETVLRNVTFRIPRYEIRVRVGRSKWNPLRYLPGAE
ncbi:hypothetical protein C8P63_10590 [Melghirimyces profundicolus]|uniref:Sporulation lipoprotein YhcN/YlaJ n=1 Tax=Melghirimyces profundicolus TaxID=1242148 RepID=A0A2T6C2F6_9BACL|nr:hypothetical protein [Melghirimyces profundicolus]PTX62495.1 hypothetical protein C8P63_10590 [Melghirimyces profundicolus]